MNIYRLSQSCNLGYDTYDSAVVIAKTAKKASKMDVEEFAEPGAQNTQTHGGEGSWCAPVCIKVELLGKSRTNKARVVCASFNAG